MRPSVRPSWLEVESAPEGAVVLAVGRGGVGPALSRAAHACALASRPLHLLHVAPLLDLEDPAPFWVRDRLAADAARLMDVVAVAAVRELARRGVHDRPTGAVMTGLSVIDGLLRKALGACVVVMEHDHLAAGPTRWVQHSRTLSVSGRSSAPVLSVPRPSVPSLPSGPAASVVRGGVTVAVKHPHRADHLIRLALCVADREGLALRVLHARWPGSELVALSDLDLARTVRRSRTWLEDRVARLSRAAGLGGVQVRVEVRTRPPAEAVVDAGRTSALLVVGRSDHRLRLGGHVGPVARAAADRAACPVLLVPESDGVEHRAARPQGG